jgi:hypothetical protein
LEESANVTNRKTCLNHKLNETEKIIKKLKVT